MNESDNFALVPRPLGTLEKAEPGAKRILSGMVADTLAVARREADELELMLRRALEFENRGEHKQAFELYEQVAEKGHLNTQYKLGQCYLRGQGVSQSESAGIAWLEKALERGHELAAFAFGLLFSFPLSAKLRRSN